MDHQPTYPENMTALWRMRPPLLRIKRLVIYFVLTAWILPTLFAFVWVTAVSLKTNREFMGEPPWTLPRDAQWVNYQKAWDRGVGTMFQNSLVIATISTLASVSISVLAPTRSHASLSALVKRS